MRIMRARPAKHIAKGDYLAHPGEPHREGELVSEVDLVRVTDVIEGDAGVSFVARCETCPPDVLTHFDDLGEWAQVWRGEHS
jgi:hypothetical protein